MSYNWSTGSSQANIKISSPGHYWLTVKDAMGCKGTDSIQIFQKNCFTHVFFPSAFTPNKDGHNDLFRATVLGSLVSFRLEVFDRAGQIIFATTDYKKGWDGTFRGKAYSSAGFVWQCYYQLNFKQPEYQSGSILLIR